MHAIAHSCCVWSWCRTLWSVACGHSLSCNLIRDFVTWHDNLWWTCLDGRQEHDSVVISRHPEKLLDIDRGWLHIQQPTFLPVCWPPQNPICQRFFPPSVLQFYTLLKIWHQWLYTHITYIYIYMYTLQHQESSSHETPWYTDTHILPWQPQLHHSWANRRAAAIAVPPWTPKPSRETTEAQRQPLSAKLMLAVVAGLQRSFKAMRPMKAHGSMARSTVMEYWLGRMEQNMLANSRMTRRKGKESTIILPVQNTPDNGWMICRRAMAKKNGQMVLSSKVSSRLEQNMDGANLFGLHCVDTKASLTTMTCMERVCTHGAMGAAIQASGPTIPWRPRARCGGLMAVPMLASLWMAGNMAKGHWLGQMEDPTAASGRTGSSTEMQSRRQPKASSGKAFGRMASSCNGLAASLTIPRQIRHVRVEPLVGLSRLL